MVFWLFCLLTYLDVPGSNGRLDSSYLAGFFVPEDGGDRVSGDFAAKRRLTTDTDDLVTRSHEERRLG